jgi:hypothetical protein
MQLLMDGTDKNNLTIRWGVFVGTSTVLLSIQNMVTIANP